MGLLFYAIPYNIYMEIELSTGKTEIKRLSLFELDHLAPPHIGKFTYKDKILGVEYDFEFDISKYAEPPEKPEGEIMEGTDKYYQMVDYKLYQAALLHEKHRQEIIESYYEQVAKYILKHCISDPTLIVTEQDWIKVYNASLVEPLTMDKIAETLHKTYNATFEGEPVLDALAGLSKGSGEYNTIKLWENKLMVKMNLTELEYSLLPLDERARKVCTIFLDDMLSYLEMEKSRKDAEKKSKVGKTS